MEELGATTYLFNLCSSSVFFFITEVRIKEIECTSSFQCFRLIKVHFFAFFYTKLGRNCVLEKRKKSWNSPGILFSHFSTNPLQLGSKIARNNVLDCQLATNASQKLYLTLSIAAYHGCLYKRSCFGLHMCKFCQMKNGF